MNRLKSFYTLHNWNGEKLLAVFDAGDYWKIGDYQYHTLQVCHWEQKTKFSTGWGYFNTVNIRSKYIEQQRKSGFCWWGKPKFNYLKSYYYETKTIFGAKTKEDVERAANMDYEKIRLTHRQAIFESFWNWKNCFLAMETRG